MYYISKHVNKELRVTVVDLQGNVLFDSSQNGSHELDNHIKRPEVHIYRTKVNPR